MTIREELKKLVAKLGGTPSKDDQTAELIHKVTDNVSGGGGGSGDGVLVVETEYVRNEGCITVMDAADIASAFMSGKHVVFHLCGNPDDQSYVYEAYLTLLAFIPREESMDQRFPLAWTLDWTDPPRLEDGKIFFPIHIE